MNIFSKVASALVGATLFLTPGVKAGIDDDHLRLIQTLESNGIMVVVNEPEFCNDEEIDGFYVPSHNVLGVCQDNRNILTNTEYDWTPNDYDTLRHEAQHALQDCISGKDNGESRLLIDDRHKFIKFATGQLTAQQIELIYQVYRENGATDEVILMELEAFSIASLNNPITMAEGVEALCRN